MTHYFKNSAIYVKKLIYYVQKKCSKQKYECLYINDITKTTYLFLAKSIKIIK